MSSATMTAPEEQVAQQSQDANSAARRREMERRVLLLSPSFGCWQGTYQLPKTKVSVQLQGVEVSKDGTTTPQSKLMTDKYPTYATVDDKGNPVRLPWKKRFAKIKTRQDAVIESASEPFPIRGVRIVPKAMATDLYRALIGLTYRDLRERRDKAAREGQTEVAETYQRRMDDARRGDQTVDDSTPVYDPDAEVQSIAYEQYLAANEFVQNLDAILEEIKQNTDPIVWSAVEHKIPKRPYQMRAKFYCGTVPVELAGSGSTVEVSEYDLQRHDDIVRQTTERVVEEAIERVIEGPRANLVKTLASLKELIARDGNVTEKSFRPIRAAIEKLRAFAFVAGQDLLDQVDSLATRMDNTKPTSLDHVTAANNGFAAALDATIREAEDGIKQARDFEEFGRELRGIDI